MRRLAYGFEKCTGANQMANHASLIKRLNDRSARIGIVGLGYVGLPLALHFVRNGYSVVGLDIDDGKVDALNAGESYIKHIESDEVADALTKDFNPTSDFSAVKELDAIILCVPTPLNRHREPDLRFVLETTDSIVPYLRGSQVISLESTTYPGTTEEELLPRIESTGLKVGRDVFLVYSPEREDPANPHYVTSTIPKICGGVTDNCLAVGKALYGQVIDEVVLVKSTRTAEMVKLLENIHRAVNIGLVNEMKMICDKMDIDIRDVIDAAATKPFGFVPYYPGPGLGGHCIPIDPFYLTWKAREFGVHTRFIELAGEVNCSMPRWVFGKLVDGLNANCRSVNGSRVLVLGIAYKKNVDDTRESPAVELMVMLRDAGAKVDYSDPFVPVFPKLRKHNFELEHVPITRETLASYDCVLLVTDHDQVDYEMVLEHAALIVDTRGVYKDAAPHVIKA